MKATLTSYDNPTVGSGSVLNQSQFVYNDFGQLVTEYQAHGGSVNTSTTPSVQYGFADGSANTIRPTALVYPNGRELTYDYGTANGLSDRCSRIASIIDDDPTHLADYSYLGRQTFVAQDDTEPQLEWTLIDLTGSNDPDTGDIYNGFDRFGRVKDNRWYNYDALADVDRIQYGYDRAGNRLWRKNVVADALGKSFDEWYQYDGVHRLKGMERGTLVFSGSQPSTLNSQQFAECWSLDATGNWQGYKQSDDGSGWSLEQARTANEVNEITDITNAVGAAWIDPVYNQAGNMTTMPQPADPTQSYTATYDAWNRLVKFEKPATPSPETVAAYAYDGAKRRIVQQTYTSGTLSETRHLYYTQPSQWQVVEERVGTSPDSADAERQFVWGLRYIDNCVLRDRDTNANGTLDERLYALQDANWNVTGLSDSSGSIQERYAYSAYGMPVWLSAALVPQSAGFDWESLYCGYRYAAGTGLFHVRNRALSPATGSWMQRDPSKYLDGLSLYAIYSILNRTDAYGLQVGNGGVAPGMPYYPPAQPPLPPNNPRSAPPDPTRCYLGYHCMPAGLGLGTHCGISVWDPKNSSWSWFDGQPNQNWTIPGTTVEIGEWDPGTATEGPISPIDCDKIQCLRDYIDDFNRSAPPYWPSGTNSNYAMRCMIEKCKLPVDWSGTETPIGYDAQCCLAWAPVGRSTGPSSCQYSRCTQYGLCACP